MNWFVLLLEQQAAKRFFSYCFFSMFLILAVACGEDVTTPSPDSTTTPNPTPNPTPPVDEQTVDTPDETGFKVKVFISSSWSGGFNGDMRIINNTANHLDNWNLICRSELDINDLWNADYSTADGSLGLTPFEWNSTLAAGTELAIGFTANGSMDQNSLTNCQLAGQDIDVELAPHSPSNNGTTGAITLEGVDDDGVVYQMTLTQGQHSFSLSSVQDTTLDVQAYTNNTDVIEVSIENGSQLLINAKAGGRAAIKLVDAGGDVRVLGARVKKNDGSLPGLPDYLALGSVSEDSTDHLNFWQDFEDPTQNKRVDTRYIYLNGGPYLGWTTWNGSVNEPGGRLVSYVRESLKLGMIPTFVYYNIPDGGESFFTNKQHIEDVQYMEDYFKDLKLALDLIAREAGDELTMMVLEPDFIGYMAQNSEDPSLAQALVEGAYNAGVLQRGIDPDFPNTLRGLIEAINYVISSHEAHIRFGWQMNLWATPPGGYTTPISGKGIVHLTDQHGYEQGRTHIYNEAAAMTQYYIDSGVLTHGADFLSIDKYGLDAPATEADAASNPADSIWFWNAEHWSNYLLFVKVMHETSGKNVVLWQLPVGHIDVSQAPSPYHNEKQFPPLGNTGRSLEDSTGSFFFGDTFNAGSLERADFFSLQRPGTDHVSRDGDLITWQHHWQEAKEAGVIMAMFGAGVGSSTTNVGSASDHHWWIHHAQQYYAKPMPLDHREGNHPGPQNPHADNPPEHTPEPTEPEPTEPEPSQPPSEPNNLTCQVPAFVSGSQYAEGDLVIHVAKLYRCVVGGWCSSDQDWAYEPGLGQHFEQAWVETSDCGAELPNTPLEPGPEQPSGQPSENDPNDQPIDNSPVGEHVIASYFVEWGVYGRDYHVHDIPAEKLTHVLYGFIPICGRNQSLQEANPGGYSTLQSQCADKQDYEVTVHDKFAALEKTYPGDVWGEMNGNFGALKKMKAAHPHIKVLPSIGGWTLSDPFFAISTNASHRATFVNSLAEFLREYDFFDGIDIDWEYPGGGGANTALGSAQDRQGYADLMQALRSMLDTLELELGRELLLTSAVGVGPAKINAVNYAAAQGYMDYILVSFAATRRAISLSFCIENSTYSSRNLHKQLT